MLGGCPLFHWLQDQKYFRWGQSNGKLLDNQESCLRNHKQEIICHYHSFREFPNNTKLHQNINFSRSKNKRNATSSITVGCHWKMWSQLPHARWSRSRPWCSRGMIHGLSIWSWKLWELIHQTFGYILDHQNLWRLPKLWCLQKASCDFLSSWISRLQI